MMQISPHHIPQWCRRKKNAATIIVATLRPTRATLRHAIPQRTAAAATCGDARLPASLAPPPAAASQPLRDVGEDNASSRWRATVCACGPRVGTLPRALAGRKHPMLLWLHRRPRLRVARMRRIAAAAAFGPLPDPPARRRRRPAPTSALRAGPTIPCRRACARASWFETRGCRSGR